MQSLPFIKKYFSLILLGSAFTACGRPHSFTKQELVDLKAMGPKSTVIELRQRILEPEELLLEGGFNLNTTPTEERMFFPPGMTQTPNLLLSYLQQKGLSWDDFGEPTTMRLSTDLQVTLYPRLLNGLKVAFGFLEVYEWQTHKGWELYELKDHSYGVLNEPAGNLKPAELPSLPPPFDVLVMKNAELFIYPLLENGFWTAYEATKFELVDPIEERTYYMTFIPEKNLVQEFYGSLFHAPTSLAASLYDRTYLDPQRANKLVPLARVTVGNNAVTTDLDALFEANPNDPITLTLQGARFSVIQRQGNTPYALRGTVPAQGPLLLNPQGNDLAGLNTYVALMDINRFTRKHLSPSDSPYLTQLVPTRFNVNGSCNAFYDSQNSSISLFAAGQGCANTALINDVIYHEWGHGLDIFTGKTRGITDGAMSEGIGDVIAAYKTGDSTTAPGFLVGDATGIRQLQNNLRYPDDLQNQVHFDGMIFGGAFWDLRQALIGRYGNVQGSLKAEQLFFRHLLVVDNYRESYESVLRLDDNDQNAGTRSPNHCLINQVFSRKGLAAPDNCTDDVLVRPIDSSFNLTTYKETPTSLMLLASSEKAYNVQGCKGSLETCLKTLKNDIPFKREGTKDQKTIFQTDPEAPLAPLKPMDEITLLGFDSKGTVVGARTFRIITK